MVELQGRRVDTGEPVTIRVAGDSIESVVQLDDGSDLPWIGPGLVDLQINGFAGIDLNDDEPAAEHVAQLSHALTGVGVTSYLPTIVTAAPIDIERRIAAIRAAVESDPLTAKLVAGIHLEGPFISPEDGARGAHPLVAVRAPDWELFERWQSLANGMIRIVTLSPEWPESIGFIERLREGGVIPAIGHTAATPEQIRNAVAAGARLSTHFGNGAHTMLPRHPNYLWEQLAADDLWASFIADGFHLPEAVMKTIMRMKGERALLVSDSVALAGMPPGTYRKRDWIERRSDSGRAAAPRSDPRLLAGSAQPMLWGISNLVRSGLATLGEAWAMASIRPARLLDLPQQHGLTPARRRIWSSFASAPDAEIVIERVLVQGRG